MMSTKSTSTFYPIRVEIAVDKYYAILPGLKSSFCPPHFLVSLHIWIIAYQIIYVKPNILLYLMPIKSILLD